MHSIIHLKHHAGWCFVGWNHGVESIYALICVFHYRDRKAFCVNLLANTFLKLTTMVGSPTLASSRGLSSPATCTILNLTTVNYIFNHSRYCSFLLISPFNLSSSISNSLSECRIASSLKVASLWNLRRSSLWNFTISNCTNSSCSTEVVISLLTGLFCRSIWVISLCNFCIERLYFL